MLDIGGVVLADFGRDAKIGRQESRSQLGNQLLYGVAFVSEAFAAEHPVQSSFVTSPVRQLVGQRRTVLRIAKTLEAGHLHVVGCHCVIRLFAIVPDVGPGVGKRRSMGSFGMGATPSSRSSTDCSCRRNISCLPELSWPAPPTSPAAS